MASPDLKNVEDNSLFSELLRRYQCLSRPFGSAILLSGPNSYSPSFSSEIADVNCWCVINPKDFKESEKTSDDSIVDSALEKAKQPICYHGALFEGFPQNLYQASRFDEKLLKMRVRVDRVVELKKDDEQYLERIKGGDINRYREVAEFYRAQGRLITFDAEKSQEYLASQMRSLFSKGIYNRNV
jgi:adenylate kinase